MKTTKINFYLTDMDIQRQYLDGLQFRRLKEMFKYIGAQQAHIWLDICQESNYTYYRESVDFLKSIREEIASYVKSDVNFISFGTGDGVKDDILLHEITKSHEVSRVMVDSSREMVNIALDSEPPSEFPVDEVFIADFMDFNTIKLMSDYLRSQYKSRHFITNLGNTIVNHPQAAILKSMRSAMNPGDLILFGAYVRRARSLEEEAKEAQEVISAYSNPQRQMQVFASLSHAGIEQTDGEMVVDYAPDKCFPQIHVVEQYFKFNRSKVVKYCHEDVYFVKGERILVSYSNKYTLESLEQLLNAHGFSIVKTFQGKTGNHVKILCQLA